jgi:hypothetical protein
MISRLVLGHYRFVFDAPRDGALRICGYHPHPRYIKTDVVSLYERVRAATEADKARRGVRMVDYETAS